MDLLQILKIKASKTELPEILPLRALYLQETNFQIRYNACHERGWTDSYLLKMDEAKIGYGSIKGAKEIVDRDTVFEFYVIPSYRKFLSQIFRALLSASGASFVESQSNDILMSSMLYEFSEKIHSQTILFKDWVVTQLMISAVKFRPKIESDSVFKHTMEPVGDYVLELQGEIVATGGFLLHYNQPFADLYMEVRKDCRQMGLGSYLVQEIKKECYLNGRIPAARCDIVNEASKATLMKAGLQITGYLLMGEIIPKELER